MINRFESFASLIPELNRCLQKIKGMEMKQWGLRASHAMCLYYLGRNEEGLTASQLTDYCKEDKAAISRCLTQLSDRELVVCDVEENKRAYRARNHLTEQGKELVQKMDQRIEQALLNGGLGMTPQQREDFYASLEMIFQNLMRYMNRQEATL